MNKLKLLKIARIQEIDLFFTERGFSRSYIHKKLIMPNFFLSKRTYYNYLSINAKQKLRAMGVDWEKELADIRPVDYMAIMEQLKHRSLLESDTKLSSEDFTKIISEGCKH